MLDLLKVPGKARISSVWVAHSMIHELAGKSLGTINRRNGQLANYVLYCELSADILRRINVLVYRAVLFVACATSLSRSCGRKSSLIGFRSCILVDQYISSDKKHHPGCRVGLDWPGQGNTALSPSG